MIKDIILAGIRSLKLSPQTLENGLCSSLWRISHTVKFMEAQYRFSGDEFWKHSAEEELGHDKLLAEEILAAYGPDILIKAVQWLPCPQMFGLIECLCTDPNAELLAGVYKAYMEMAIFELPISEQVLPYCAKFVELHKSLDVAHVEEAIAWLESKDIPLSLLDEMVNTISSALEAEMLHRG